ncbi:MAG: hypothetical protein KY468_07090 [Armatimonadetes bacterium]|nr:hypothetical protein [Armatimonadota bacterium]
MAEIERRRIEIARQLLPSVLSLYLTYQMKRQLGGGDIENILKSFDEDVTEDAKQQAGDESEQQLLNTMETYKAQLRALAGDVQKINAPVPAQRFHNGYLVSLGSYDNAVSELQHSLIKRDASAVTRLSTLPQSLNGITSATDRELQRLLAQYNLPRTFSVSDEERGGLLSAP